MAAAFQILPERLRVSAAKCYFGKETEPDGVLAAILSRIPDREGKFFPAELDERVEGERIRRPDSVCVLTLFTETRVGGSCGFLVINRVSG